jgi:hypothetical protein
LLQHAIIIHGVSLTNLWGKSEALQELPTILLQ